MERVAYVANRCQNISIPNLKNRKVRNALAHLDEYLVEELAASQTGWFIDIAVRSRAEFKAPNNLQINYCRSYIISEDRLLHFGHEVRLEDLKTEAKNVLSSVWLGTDVSYYSGPLYDVKIRP